MSLSNCIKATQWLRSFPQRRPLATPGLFSLCLPFPLFLLACLSVHLSHALLCVLLCSTDCSLFRGRARPETKRGHRTGTSLYLVTPRRLPPLLRRLLPFYSASCFRRFPGGELSVLGAVCPTPLSLGNFSKAWLRLKIYECRAK